VQALILAAGKGERMRPLTLAKPKPLLEVCGLSLIEHHLIQLKKAGFSRIIINVSWLAQQIMQKLGDGQQYGVEIRYSYEGQEPLETGGGIVKAMPLIGDKPFLVVNGDIKTSIDFSTLALPADSLAHLVLVKNPAHNSQGDFAIESNAQLNYGNIENKLTYSGVGLYHPDLFQSCEIGKYSVVPILKQAMQSQQVTGEFFAGQWDDIGTIERLIEINKNCKKK